MVGSVRNDSFCEGGLSVNGGTQEVGGPVDGDVQIVMGIV
jgi:hypothetical protein